MAGGQWSELEVIRRLARRSGHGRSDIIKGIGDDCAIVAPEAGLHWVITTDMLVDEVHFSLAGHPPYLLGRKCMAVNFSDIAAMGAEPIYALLSLALPSQLNDDWLEEWLRGVDSMLQHYHCELIGGDTVRGTTMCVNVTVIGSVEKGRALQRDTAGPKESIFVSGHLGSAAAGLALLQNIAELTDEQQKLAEPFLQHHFNPAPDLLCGGILGKSGLVTAMQDLSDGLATDLSHICQQSGIGAIVEEASLPHHEDLPEISLLLGQRMSDLQLAGGDDYHLVFTVQQGKEEQLLAYAAAHGSPPLYRVGTTTEGPGVFLQSSAGLREITFGGFQHKAGS